MIQFALWCRRADVDRFLDDIGHKNMAEIYALSTIEKVAHDRETWLAAIQTLEIVRSMAEVKDVEAWIENFIEMVTFRKREQKVASPEEMARQARSWR